ncbi:MAG: type II secretion system secretin GspD [Deltaproteobacteria bacterium]|nr:type II secretion system secretin GspD [Deltaproteobacteria bacterium]
MIYDKILQIILAVFIFLSPVLSRAQLPQGSARLPSQETPAPKKELTAAPREEGTESAIASPEEKIEGEKKEEELAGGEDLVYLNVQDQDIKEVIKQIAKATGRNFIIDAKVSGKVTILSNKMMTKDEAYQAFLSALQMAGFTTVTGPAGILKIVPLRDAKNFPIPTHVDTTPYTDSYITRLIRLDNISANDMSEAIKGLISKDGNLFAYPETNTLVLTDSGTNIDRLMKIIKELDQEGPQQVVEIIPIQYANAKELASIVLSLYDDQKKAAGARPGAIEETAQVSKIISDERTNSIIVLASKRAIDKVKELINRLDAQLEEGTEGKIHVHYLKYAKAKDITAVLQGLASAAAKPPGQAGADKGPVIAELEDFKVAADDATNSLLITSTAKTYNVLVDRVLDKLDIPRKQVYLEALVVEFSLSSKKQFGVQANGGAIAGNVFGFGETFQQLTGLFDPFNANNTSSPFLTSAGLLGGILSRQTVDIKVPKADGTTQTVSVPAYSAFVTALSAFGNTNVVASPNLLALDNEESIIEILRKEPEPGQVLVTAAGLGQKGPPQRVDAGLTLKLTPQITEKGAVRLKIDQKFSSFVKPKDPTLQAQAIVERKIQTSVITNDGQTVVIGGLMQDEVSFDKTKIPILGDIPLLGYLFQKNITDKSKSNLLLFITPHIIRDSGDFDVVLRRKLGQQGDFIGKNFKKKEQKDLTTMITTHNAELLDILEKAPPVSSIPSGTEIGKSSSATTTSTTTATAYPSQPAIITARPEDEPRMTLVLPPSTVLPPSAEITTTTTTTVETTQAKKKKGEKTTTPPAETTPPMQIIPPQSSKTQSTTTTTTATTVQPSGKKRAPVLVLPPGTTPDLGD